MSEVTPPVFKETSFHCPHCNGYSHQIWDDIHNWAQSIYHNDAIIARDN